MPPATATSLHRAGESRVRFRLIRRYTLCPILFAMQGIAQSSSSNIAAARTAMEAGIAAATSGDLVKAKREFARAVALTPKIPEGHAALGSVLLSMGEFSAAVEELESAHSLAPGDPAIDLNLANAEVALGRHADAVKLFREVLNADPPPSFSPQDSIAFATALAATGNSTGAETTLRSVLETTPGSSELNDALGVVLAKRGAMEAGLDRFQQAVALNPSLLRAQGHLGAALIALNRPADAFRRYVWQLPPPLRTSTCNCNWAAPIRTPPRSRGGRGAPTRRAIADPGDPLRSPLRTRTRAAGQRRPGAALPLFDVAFGSATPTSDALTNYALARVQTGNSKGRSERSTRAR